MAVAGPRDHAGRLSRVGTGLRLLVCAAVLGVLLTAQLDRHDDWFPLGMLGQYAVARDPDGQVVSTYLDAVDARGQRTPVTLRAETAGLTRVELELALPRLLEDPAGLEPVARRLRTVDPDREVVALEVRQVVHQLRDGGRDGPPQERVVLHWAAQP